MVVRQSLPGKYFMVAASIYSPVIGQHRFARPSTPSLLEALEPLEESIQAPPYPLFNHAPVPPRRPDAHGTRYMLYEHMTITG
jgi:hypothetical protein